MCLVDELADNNCSGRTEFREVMNTTITFWKELYFLMKLPLSFRYWVDHNLNWVMKFTLMGVSIWIFLDRSHFRSCRFVFHEHFDNSSFLPAWRDTSLYKISRMSPVCGDFPNLWIGIRGAMQWRVRSPDPTVSDFLQGYFKSKMSTNELINLEN